MGVNPTSSGPPRVRTMGRTCGEPDEIKKNTHPENITALFREKAAAEHSPLQRGLGTPRLRHHRAHPDLRCCPANGRRACRPVSARDNGAVDVTEIGLWGVFLIASGSPHVRHTPTHGFRCHTCGARQHQTKSNWPPLMFSWGRCPCFATGLPFTSLMQGALTLGSAVSTKSCTGATLHEWC